ncbi:unnamed protein product [Cyprideis torosa]|uniref:Uncharacterized protein n=1 Tax=Cyprideis torosa TaxID=163714 RepID=A0A7R8WJT4_9CRUS|nr:unnamed protein product [Cyprideis torosa]CAG0902379.1 unnamed protein product [Cyprideis torosa]
MAELKLVDDFQDPPRLEEPVNDTQLRSVYLFLLATGGDIPVIVRFVHGSMLMFLIGRLARKKASYSRDHLSFCQTFSTNSVKMAELKLVDDFQDPRLEDPDHLSFCQTFSTNSVKMAELKLVDDFQDPRLEDPGLQFIEKRGLLYALEDQSFSVAYKETPISHFSLQFELIA